MYTGGDNAFPFNEIATPAPRGHVPQMQGKRTGEKGGGYMLMKPLVDTAAALGVQSILDTRVQRLVVESDGRVVRIIALHYGKALAVTAPRGAVLATPSFALNESMVARPHRGSPRPAALSKSTTELRSSWRRHSGPTWPTWTPPKWLSWSTRS
jgi:3-oxo-5alpha-steroid 4-dehydrogenase